MKRREMSQHIWSEFRIFRCYVFINLASNMQFSKDLFNISIKIEMILFNR